MDPISKAVPGAITASETGAFRGYAARYLNIDRQGHFIIPGAFAKAAREFMDDGGLIVRDHANKVNDVIGTVISMAEDSTGLLVDVSFSGTESGQDTRQKIAEGAVRKMSTLFYAKARHYSERDIKAVWNQFGYQPSEQQLLLAKKGAVGITEVTVIDDISVVARPANPEAVILAVKSFDEPENEAVSEPKVSRAELIALFERAWLAVGNLGRP